jgi:hypothetical protein
MANESSKSGGREWTGGVRSFGHLTLVEPCGAATVDAEQGSSFETLRRLRDGWRPSQCLLDNAHRAERWSVARQADAAAYQFIAVSTQRQGTSLMIATALALSPQEGWAFLFSDKWVRLGEPSWDMRPFDPADVAKCAAEWLRTHTD